MDDPFINGLLVISFLVFALLKFSFNSINRLQLELDKKNENYYFKILNWISRNTIEFEGYYLIKPDNKYFENHIKTDQGKKVPEDFEYNSGTNTLWLTAEELQKMI